MDAMEDTYNYFMPSDNIVSRIVSKLQMIEKFMMRFSAGFLFRNIVDTWVQLYTQLYYEQGAYAFVKDPKLILRYTLMTGEIYNIYKDISTDRLGNTFRLRPSL